jgi:hypothetical protein
MRRYDDPVEVRKGRVPGSEGPVEGPEQFLWKGWLWKVSNVLAHWVETGPWWQFREVAPVLGADPEEGPDRAADRAASVHDLLAEREVWRVEAGRGQVGTVGVFDLVFDWAQGSWRLSRCMD